MSKITTPQETTNLLLSIMNYCQSNSLLLWGIDKSGLMEFRVGKQTHFLSSYLNNIYHVYEVTKDNYNLRKIDLSFKNAMSSTCNHCSIKPDWEWIDDQPEKQAEILVHAFWDGSRSVFSDFVAEWCSDQTIDLASTVKYKNKEYPQGFSDPKIYPYSKCKNWRHFIDAVPAAYLIKYLEQPENIINFSRSLKEIESSGGLNAHSFLNYLLSKPEIVATLSEDAKFNISKMLFEIVPSNLWQGYSKNYAFLDNLIKNKSKEELLSQEHKLIIEKVSFTHVNLFDYFNQGDLTLSTLARIGKEVLGYIEESHELKNNGLEELDIVYHKNKNICYLNLTDNTLINKDSFANLFIEILANCLSEKQSLLTPTQTGAYELNSELLESITRTTTSHWILQKQLADKEQVKNKKAKI